MRKFQAELRRTILETADVEIEAESLAAAEAIAKQMLSKSTTPWVSEGVDESSVEDVYDPDDEDEDE